MNDYGIGFTQSPQYQPTTFTVGRNGGPQQSSQAGGAGPMVPGKGGSILRKPIQATQDQDDKQKKRKSWFSLKGSRN